MNNVDVIKCLYQAFAEGDLDTVSSLLDPNVEWVESDGIPYGGVFNGYEAVLNGVFTSIGNEWDNFTSHAGQFIDAGDIVITLGTDSGTYKATGKSMQAPTASIWTLKDSKVVKFRQYIDTLAVFKATKIAR